jgi:cyclophilin family peptidyl-prolyl cis-trans isomerase
MNGVRRGWRLGAAAAVLAALSLAVIVIGGGARLGAQDKAQPRPVIVVDTSKGTFAFETYPLDAPKTVAHVIALVRRGFYDGQRILRATPGFVVQWGDPRSREPEREAEWGRGPEASSGNPIGAAEIPNKHMHVEGAVAMAHPGNPASADSQMYVTLAKRPDLDGYYAVFGRIIEGADVPRMLQRGDMIMRMYVRE